MSKLSYTETTIEPTSVTRDTLDKRLIVYNDHINTFDFVIQALVDVCKHSTEQAEQCAYIIHHKGKYAVKHGTYELLKPMQEAIAERGMKVAID